jgi:hypothetical protein
MPSLSGGTVSLRQVLLQGRSEFKVPWTNICANALQKNISI